MSEMAMAEAGTVDIVATDVTRQRTWQAAMVDKRKTIAELVQEMLARLGLATRDAQGNPLAYHARLARERRQLHGGERVGDVLRDSDEISLVARIDAGRC